MILAPVSAGELIDRITILGLKAMRIADPERLRNVLFERGRLLGIWNREIAWSPALSGLVDRLAEVNANLWYLEDELRACEQRGAFGAHFVKCARNVYRLNDERAAIKREINKLTGSAIVEEKSYAGA